jgi:hypothetical protein
MGKKKRKKKKISKFKATSADSKPNKRPSSISFFKNVSLLVGAFLLLYLMKNYNNGYKRAFENLVKGNLKEIKQYKNLNHEQKLGAKVGLDAKYLAILKKYTPRDAIIIMPPDSVLLPYGQESKFSQYITRKSWASYFVYPRKLIYEDEKDAFPQIYKKATHVAIVNYWGYQKLTYKVNTRHKYTILPLNLNGQKK